MSIAMTTPQPSAFSMIASQPHDITELLQQLHLSEFIKAFKDNWVDLDALFMMSDEHLKELGLPLGPRLKLVSYLREQKQSRGAASQPSFRPSPVVAPVSSMVVGTRTSSGGMLKPLSLAVGPSSLSSSIWSTPADDPGASLSTRFDSELLSHALDRRGVDERHIRDGEERPLEPERRSGGLLPRSLNADFVSGGYQSLFAPELTERSLSDVSWGPPNTAPFATTSTFSTTAFASSTLSSTAKLPSSTTVTTTSTIGTTTPAREASRGLEDEIFQFPVRRSDLQYSAPTFIPKSEMSSGNSTPPLAPRPSVTSSHSTHSLSPAKAPSVAFVLPSRPLSAPVPTSQHNPLLPVPHPLLPVHPLLPTQKPPQHHFGTALTQPSPQQPPLLSPLLQPLPQPPKSTPPLRLTPTPPSPALAALNPPQRTHSHPELPRPQPTKAPQPTMIHVPTDKAAKLKPLLEDAKGWRGGHQEEVACGSCTFLNSPSTTACVMCQKPLTPPASLATTLVAATSPALTAAISPAPSFASALEPRLIDPKITQHLMEQRRQKAIGIKGGRVCGSCTFSNKVDALMCASCSKVLPPEWTTVMGTKSKAPPVVPEVVKSVPAEVLKKKKKKKEKKEEEEKEEVKHANVPPCPVCTYINSPAAQDCVMCGTALIEWTTVEKKPKKDKLKADESEITDPPSPVLSHQKTSLDPSLEDSKSLAKESKKEKRRKEEEEKKNAEKEIQRQRQLAAAAATKAEREKLQPKEDEGDADDPDLIKKAKTLERKMRVGKKQAVRMVIDHKKLVLAAQEAGDADKAAELEGELKLMKATLDQVWSTSDHRSGHYKNFKIDV